MKIRNGVTLATRREKLLFGVEGIRQDKALAEREGSRGQDGGTDGGETEASGGREDMIQKRKKGELKSKRDREYFGLSWCLRGKEPTCQCRRHRRIMLNPWVRKFPWRRKWQPPPQPSILAWKTPWTEEPGRLWSMEWQESDVTKQPQGRGQGGGHSPGSPVVKTVLPMHTVQVCSRSGNKDHVGHLGQSKR